MEVWVVMVDQNNGSDAPSHYPVAVYAAEPEAQSHADAGNKRGGNAFGYSVEGPFPVVPAP